MGRATSKQTPAPVRGRQSAPPAPATAPRGQGGSRRGGVVMLAALLVCAAVVTGIVLTNGGDGVTDATGPDAAATTAPAPFRPVHAPGDPADRPDTAAPAVQAELKKVLGEVERLDKTVWAKEVEAQKYEEFFIRLWDDFRKAQDKAAVLRNATFQTLAYGKPAGTSQHDWGVTVTRFEGAGASVDHAGWGTLLDGLAAAGYRAVELEFHQSSFEHEPGRPARSVVSTLFHLVNDKLGSRQVLRAKLNVEWADEPGTGGVFVPRAIEAADLTVADRTGGPAFEALTPQDEAARLKLQSTSEFVLVYDLDGNGLSEVIVPGENLLMRNEGGWQFTKEQIVPGTHGMDASVIADFDGDALPDLLCRKGDELYLVRGAPGGRFSASPPERAVTLGFATATAMVLTAGDVDADGDLDAWLGQYKPQYARGQMPTPYYDANDGYPSALLVNDGTGRFADGTEAAGLAAKRFRRVQAGSFVDLDGDRDLDLLVNADFSGLDVYFNDGRGRFTDVTGQVIDERHNFGMGHTFADFNLDGRLDVYTIGMSSTTARRLGAMNAGRKEFPEHQAKRAQMGYGNRMFLAPPTPVEGAAEPSAAPPRYVQPAFRDDVARTGWSWGTTSPDVDNDGDPDIYVANGNISGVTCRDYCTTYWRRDIYFGNSSENPVLHGLFFDHGMRSEESWNGFEHNVLYLNEGGRGFVNVAHLFGVAFEYDARNVISDDLDGDGKVDLLVVEKQFQKLERYLHLLRNKWPTAHHWIGVRLAEAGPGFSPVGAEVRVHLSGDAPPRIARIVTGDSLQAQHATTRHFGLGATDKVEAIEVTWPNGKTTHLPNPAVDQYHPLRP
jgi:hypothetical protein